MLKLTLGYGEQLGDLAESDYNYILLTVIINCTCQGA
jgi:hypothetical protein